MKRAVRYLVTASIAALALAGAAQAQPEGSVTEEGSEPTGDQAITTSNEIVVQATIGYRNRSDDAEPVLIYDTDYFQRFEPLTAGDALKRVPSVAFLSDVIESDGARLRGLDPGYTQILINGEKVPGSNVDRSFFLDRIPAELLERVEIVRSSSARRSGDSMAGTLNIVLRDGYELDGGYVRAGGLLFDDGELKPSLGAVWGGAVGPGRLLVGGNLQGRYNPKKKKSFRYENEDGEPEFDNREDQDDTRDGTDYALNATYGIEGETTDIELGGYYVRTDRDETERSLEYDDEDAETGPIPDGNLLTDASQFEDIDQENYALTGKVKHRWSLGETSLKLGYARFDEDIESTELGIDFDTDEDPPEFEGERTRQKIRDSEFSLGLDHAFEISPGIKLIVGGFYQDKDRDTDITVAEDGFELTEDDRDNYDQFEQEPGDFETSFVDFEPGPGGLNKIEEHRRDLFALVEGKGSNISWEAGLRYEHTKLKIEDLTVDPEDAEHSNDYGLLLPSASVKFDVTARDRVTVSVARTNRRPRFDFISPALLEAELGDNDLVGNPDLKPETAWGIDAGYERRIGRTGVAGINFFYRKVKDLVELANTGLPGSEYDPGDDPLDPEPVDVFVLQPRNTGDGKAWGVELDLSTSLSFIGLPDTGVFGNFAYLDSKIDDEFGERRFNGQPKYVYNIGFIQDLPSWGAAFGTTFRKQGPAKDRIVGEEVRTTYGADLEIFIEKRFGNWLTIRGVGSNLLNARKKEEFLKFNTIDDQLDGDFDEFEQESEKAGPVFQLIARAAF